MVDQIDFKLCALDFTSHSHVAGKFALGSGRKKEKTKHKVVPDMFTKGALVWNVQVNFTLLLDCLGDVRWTGSCDWVRWKVCSATSISVWQHVKLSEQICPWDTLACCWDVHVQQPTTNKWTYSSLWVRLGIGIPTLSALWFCSLDEGNKAPFSRPHTIFRLFDLDQ